MKKWTIEDSKELYNINGWGTSYFGINENGNVYVNPSKNNVKIDISQIIDELALRDCFVFPIFWTIASRKWLHVLKKQPRNTTTKEKALSSIPSK